jgi:hypothetical protein
MECTLEGKTDEIPFSDYQLERLIDSSGPRNDATDFWRQRCRYFESEMENKLKQFLLLRR